MNFTFIALRNNIIYIKYISLVNKNMHQDKNIHREAFYMAESVKIKIMATGSLVLHVFAVHSIDSKT